MRFRDTAQADQMYLNEGVSSHGATPRTRQFHQAEDVCPITRDPIDAYAPTDVFTTTDGTRYNLESLRAWFASSPTAMMPHTNLPAPIDRLRSAPPADRVMPYTRLPTALKILAENRHIGIASYFSAVAWPGFLVCSIYRMRNPTGIASTNACDVLGGVLMGSLLVGAAVGINQGPFALRTASLGALAVFVNCAEAHYLLSITAGLAIWAVSFDNSDWAKSVCLGYLVLAFNSMFSMALKHE